MFICCVGLLFVVHVGVVGFCNLVYLCCLVFWLVLLIRLGCGGLVGFDCVIGCGVGGCG